MLWFCYRVACYHKNIGIPVNVHSSFNGPWHKRTLIRCLFILILQSRSALQRHLYVPDLSPSYYRYQTDP